MLALLTAGWIFPGQQNPHPRVGILVFSKTVLALGTYAGGWRIIRTLGRRIIALDPPAGFAAESVASSVLSTPPSAFG